MSPLDLSFLRDRAVQKRLAAFTLAFALGGVIYAVLAPKWYRSVATVVPARGQRQGISSMLGAEVASLAAGFDSAGGGADVPRIAAVLQSVSVTDAVVEKFNLRDRYGKRYQENARDALWEHCDVKALPKPNLVQVSCEDKDPRFVQEMLAYLLNFANQVFRRVNVSSASEEVNFLEKRVAELRQQADGTATRMREFQEKYQIVDIETQTKAVVSALATLQTQRINKELELDYARTFSAGDEATLQQLRSQIAVVNEKLRDLEQPATEVSATPANAKSRGKTSRAGVFPAALDVPKLRAEFEAIFRDRKVSEATLIFALERLEAAKANEAREVSTFQVLDMPTLPTRKARPQRLRIVAMATLLGIAASIAWEWARRGGVAELLGIGPAARSARSSRDGTSRTA
ncbi:GumC family protein [Anaeromyxobacter soli]|uniref:GumC family protein n=1 Tax=Anaeromyxobacter soli TaxID=2922725 RepID=UPI001FAFA9FB|nr:Wzz/FepE/Etk N-terminal domain-containing protein [Anaeromyxobacter sp. SG29]